MSEERSGMDRRTFLRRAAATTAAAAWAAPLIHTVAATPAYAQSAGSPVCNHSLCVAACNAAADAANRSECKQHGRCQTLCDQLCPNPGNGGGLEDRPCIYCGNACDPGAFSFDSGCNISATC